MSTGSGKIANSSVSLEMNPLWVAAYRKYFRVWVRLARTTRLSDDDAKDIVHGIVCSLLTDRSKSFESVDHIRNYVARSVLNRAYQLRHREDRRTPWTENIELRFPVMVEETLDDEYFTESLMSGVLNLSRRDADVIKMRFYGGYSYEEMSKILGAPISTLKSREEAGLRRLRKWLRKKGL
jgi:RNA polymerase sigma factor (sigma-70 family)